MKEEANLLLFAPFHRTWANETRFWGGGLQLIKGCLINFSCTTWHGLPHKVVTSLPLELFKNSLNDHLSGSYQK